MIHIPLEVPGEVVAIGALAPITEVLTAHLHQERSHCPELET
jgi:hypothetical protein